MTRFYAFNGDADGLCALQQLRLVDPLDATLVTGVKRDIQLLRRVSAAAGDDVTVLDISLDANRDDVHRLLDAGVAMRYFDHHHAGTLPQHRRFEAHIDESPDVCTSTLVDRYLAGRHRPWAIVAAYGDNLKDLADTMARSEGMDITTTRTLERLGICLNYNAYGDAVSELCFDPEDLARSILPYADPMEFVGRSPAFARLSRRFEEDMRQTRCLEPLRRVPGATIVLLPDEAWARRAIGVLANELTQGEPDSAIAILSPKRQGGFSVSVRVPEHRPVAADEFCRRFGSGGGRKLAAGINHLASSDIDRFAAAFEALFRTG